MYNTRKVIENFDSQWEEVKKRHDRHIHIEAIIHFKGMTDMWIFQKKIKNRICGKRSYIHSMIDLKITQG